MKGLRVAAMIAVVGSAFPSMAAAQYSIDNLSLGSVYQARRFGNSLYDSAVNKTFITYNSAKQDIYVRAYNHSSKSWETPVKVWTLNRSDANSYHDYGVLRLLPNGKLAVFYAIHTSAGYMVTAPNTHSATGTWTRKTISTDRVTYPTPIVSGSSIYFLYSQNTNLNWPYRKYQMIKSTDNGATWSSADTIVDTKESADKYSEVYGYGVYARQGKIYFTYTLCGGPGGHNAQCKNLYMNYIDTADDQIYSVAGDALGSQVDEKDLPKSLVISASSSSPDADNAATNIWNPIPAPDSNGRPSIGFGYYVGSSRAIKFGQFNNGSWTFQDVATGESGFNDMAPAKDGGFDLLFSSGGKIKSAHRSTSGSISTRYSLTFDDQGTTADTWRASLVANRSTVDAIGTSYNGAGRTDDYSGKWPIFAISND